MTKMGTWYRLLNTMDASPVWPELMSIRPGMCMSQDPVKPGYRISFTAIRFLPGRRSASLSTLRPWLSFEQERGFSNPRSFLSVKTSPTPSTHQPQSSTPSLKGFSSHSNCTMQWEASSLHLPTAWRTREDIQSGSPAVTLQAEFTFID